MKPKKLELHQTDIHRPRYAFYGTQMHKLKHLACIKSKEITTPFHKIYKYPKSSYSNHQ